MPRKGVAVTHAPRKLAKPSEASAAVKQPLCFVKFGKLKITVAA
jgi:hypothetical protein